MPNLFRSIFHPTSFSGSQDAFVHALRIALSARGELRLLHVNAPGEAPSFDPFPRIRSTLALWGQLDVAANEEAMAKSLGLRVTKDLVWDRNPRAGILDAIDGAPPDLLVLSLADRTGLPDLFQESIAEHVAHGARAPSLCIRRGGGGFVSQETGEVALRSILIPVVPHVPAAGAIDAAISLYEQLGGARPDIHLLGVGGAPKVPDLAPTGARFHFHSSDNSVVEAINEVQARTGADLICMPVARSRSLLASVRGKIAERVLRSAACPVLMVPAG